MPNLFDTMHSTLNSHVSSSKSGSRSEVFKNRLLVELLSRVSLVLLMRVLMTVMLNCGGGEGSLARRQEIVAPWNSVFPSSRQKCLPIA